MSFGKRANVGTGVWRECEAMVLLRGFALGNVREVRKWRLIDNLQYAQTGHYSNSNFHSI